MNVEDLIIVSVDDHVIEPPGMFDRHMPADLRDKAPKLITNADGSNSWVYEDRVVANVGLNAVVGRPPEEYGCEPTSYDHMRPGTYQIDKRIEDMNANGILGSICFGTFVSFDGGFFVGARDKALTNRVIQAYNDWHIDEWAGHTPGRIIPMALVPQWDIDLIVAEVKRVVAKGCHAITFSDNPALKGMPSLHNPYWEPLWKVCAENEVVICCHIGTGASPPHSSMETPIEAWITSFPMTIATSAADWLYLQAFERYPNLKVALSEGGIGWVPYFLERADFTHQHHRAWTNLDLKGKLPSDIFREHFITCFIDDVFGLKNHADVGIDTICYECDYPHSDSVWPRSPEVLMQSLVAAKLDRAQIDKVTHQNAMRHFHYDPIATLGRENCTVGALRAQATHVHLGPDSFGGARPIELGAEKRRVTSGDVAKLFVANSGEPAEAA